MSKYFEMNQLQILIPLQHSINELHPLDYKRIKSV